MTMSQKRKYSLNEELGLDEDDTHEFKRSCAIAIEDVPLSCVRLRSHKITRTLQPVSKTICAFLNSGKGGKVFLGVGDDGQVQGVRLSHQQRQHLLLSLADVLERFTPPVPKDQVKVEFVPVMDEVVEEEEEEMGGVKKEHVIRSAKLCWCDSNADDLPRHPTRFVVELDVGDGGAGLEGPLSFLPNVYQNEEGLVYCRRTASNIQMDIQDVVTMTEDRIRAHYRGKREELEKKRDELRKQLE